MSEEVKSVFEATFTNVPPISGSIHASVWEVVETREETREERSNHIIRIDSDWLVRVRWSIEGALASCICGDWCLHLFMESVGNGPEFQYPDPKPPHEDKELHLDLDPCKPLEDNKYWYTQDIVVPKGRIQEEHCSVPYKPVVALTYRDACFRPGPMAGFVELPTIQFYPVEKPGQTT